MVDLESNIKTAKRFIEKAGSGGVSVAGIHKIHPFSKWKKKKRNAVLTKMIDDNMIGIIKVRSGRRGPGTNVYLDESVLKFHWDRQSKINSGNVVKLVLTDDE